MHSIWFIRNTEIHALVASSRSGPGGPPGAGGRPMGDKMDGDRAAYRRAPGAASGGDKAGAAGPGSAPMEFRGGFGRGKTE